MYNRPKKYPWQRFWCPKGVGPSLKDGGFLVDPDTLSGQYWNREVVSFAKIRDIPCLILLGEPGSGKSTALTEEKDTTETSLKDDDSFLHIDLRRFQTDLALSQSLFDSQSFLEWKKGSHRLHLFLDSFDECLLRIDVLASLLDYQLSNCPTNRLTLRIACRTAAWPVSLEKRLRTVWPTDGFGVFEIAPLRKSDIHQAADIEGIDGHKFLEQVDLGSVTALALKPITLRFLMRTFAENGSFPFRQWALYDKGCSLLCEETNEARRDAGYIRTLSSHQMLMIAGRIAAGTVLGNRYAIWTGPNDENVAPEDITVQELSGHSETVLGQTFEVTDHMIREVLSTALFSSRGSNRTGWAHHTYAEFLAARYLLAHNLQSEQIGQLLIHSGDGEGKVVPQLHQLAAWIAGQRTSIFDKILADDPEVLLLSDLTSVDQESRQQLVDGLLRYTAAGNIPERVGLRPECRKLRHDGIGGQLRPQITDKQNDMSVRELAILLARACNVTDVQEELAVTALDSDEDYRIRRAASFALSKIGDLEVCKRLQPLAYGGDDDPDDELKGYALEAIWPDGISTGELFELLTVPKKKNRIGSYAIFISKIADSLTPDMLPKALNWAAQKSTTAYDDPLNELIDKLIMIGFSHVANPKVLMPFTRIIEWRSRRSGSLLGYRREPELSRQIEMAHTNRQQVVRQLVEDVASDPASSVIYRPINQFVTSHDFRWLCQSCIESDSRDIAIIYSRVARRVFDPNCAGHLDSIVALLDASPILGDAFRPLIGPIELDSEEAVDMRRYHNEWGTLESGDDHPPKQVNPDQRIRELLRFSEEGKENVFFVLTRELTLQKDGRYDHSPHATDIRKFTGWIEADASMRRRLVSAARRSLEVENPGSTWIGHSNITYSAIGGYRALRLLLEEDPSTFRRLGPDTWKRWAIAVVGQRVPTVGDDVDIHQDILCRALSHATKRVVACVEAVLDKEDQSHQTIAVLHRFRKCWDPRLTAMLVRKAEDGSLSLNSVSQILGVLLKRDVPAARDIVESMIPLPLPNENDEREIAVMAADLLLRYASDAGWDVVWPAICDDERFGRLVVEKSVGSGSLGVPHIDEDNLADLYIWLEHRYPFSEDPNVEGVHMVGTREMVGRWRDDVLRYLSERGTHAACEAVDRIAAEFPEIPWLESHVRNARKIARQMTWRPLDIGELGEMIGGQNRRLVRDGYDLVEIVIESLKRL